MLKRQFSKFKNQLSTNQSQTDRPHTQDDSPSPVLTLSPAFQPIQILSDNIPSPQGVTQKKIGFLEMINESKKNSLKSNLSLGNNLSSNGFRGTQTTYFTDRNEQDDIILPTHVKNNSSASNISYLKRIKTERTPSIQNNIKSNRSLKFQHVKIVDKQETNQKKSKQPSLVSFPSPLPKHSSGSTLVHASQKSLTERRPSNNASQIQLQGLSEKQHMNTLPSQTNQQSYASLSSPYPKSNLKQVFQNALNVSKQNSQSSANSPLKSSSPLMLQRMVSEMQQKKTPFTSICKQIHTNMLYVQRKIKSKVQFFNHFSKILSNKSQYLQGIFLIPEIQEVVQDPVVIDRALVQVINSSEFRSSTHAQRGLIKSLIIELSILNKEIFDVYLSQSKQEIMNLKEKILYEREEVEYLTIKMTAKHYPNFSKKATLINSLSHHNMPITYNKEKYDLMEEKLGKFNLITQENRFVCSEIEKVICNLKEINYNNNNPYRNTIW